jgi:hypothetical protein
MGRKLGPTAFACARCGQDLGEFRVTITDAGDALLMPHRYAPGMVVYQSGELTAMRGRLFFRSEYAGFRGETPSPPFTTGKPKFRWGCRCRAIWVYRSDTLAELIDAARGRVWLGG